MSLAESGLQTELLDAGQAIGLINGSGSLNDGWFGSPGDYIQNILKDTTQREATLRALEGLLPSDPNAPAGSGERWHPLLASGKAANIYLVVTGDGSSTTTVSAAVCAEGPQANLSDSTKPSARLAVRVPLLNADGTGLTPVAATSQGPVSAELHINIALQRGTGGAPIGLQAIKVTVSLALDADPSVHVVLEGLDLGDGPGPSDVALDPQNLTGEAAHVVVGLLRSALADQSWMTGAVQSLANGLPGILGLAADGIPALPVAELLHDPTAIKSWLLALVTPTGGTAPITLWLGHFATLLGLTSPTTQGTGTTTDPWRVTIADVGSGRLEMRMATDHDPKTGALRLRPGVAVVLAPSVSGTKAEVQAEAVLAAIPLAGTAPAVPVPQASLLVVTPSDGSTLVSASGVTIAQARGGITWNGANVVPLLELDGVTFGPVTNLTVDLTNATSVENAAASAVRAAIHGFVGTSGPGAAITALLGIDAPAGASTWPPSLLADLTGFAAHPLAEIGSVHRRVLASAAPNDWGVMLGQVAALLGVSAAPQGAGTPDDPWRVPLAQQGSLAVVITAWNDPDGSTDRLRIGVRAGVDTGPLHAGWQFALAGFDLPASGAATAKFLGAQRLGISISPVPALPSVGGVSVTAATFTAAVDWQAGTAVTGKAEITGVTVTGDGLDVNVGTMVFPAPPGTAANPLAGLGVGAGAVEGLVRVLALRAAAAWGGEAVSAVAALLGVGATLPDLPAEWPRLGNPAQPGALFEHPLATLEAWWAEVLTTLTGDGTALGEVWAGWAGQLLQGAFAGSPAGVPSVAGAGTPTDPWQVALSTSAEGLLWLDPGPPAAWLTAATSAIADATNFEDILAVAGRLGRHDSDLAAAVANLTDGASADLAALSGWLSTSDGVVLLSSQQPNATGWATGSAVNAAHPGLPTNADSVAQVLAALGALPSTTPVLCISAPFGTAADWHVLIGSTPDPAAHFDFRQPGVPPTGVDLTTVTATGRYYTCDLADDGSGDRSSQILQVTRAMQRVSALHAGAQVAVVAHSVSALAALAAIQAAPANTANALVALGAPLNGSPLIPLKDPSVAAAVRLVGNLAASGITDATLQQAVVHLATGLDGYLPPAGAGSTPVAAPYPVASFDNPPPLTLPAGVAGTAVAGVVTADLLSSLRGALQTAAAAIPPPNATPTHAGTGLRAHLATGGPATGPNVDVWVETELGRVAIASGAAGRALQPGLRLRAALTNPGGWLVGSPDVAGATSGGARVRWAEIGVDITPPASPGGPPVVTPHLVLHDAALRAPLRPQAVLTDADAAGLLGEVLRSLSIPAPAAGGAVAALLDALTALGIAVPDGHGGTGVAADALAALIADPVGFAGPKLATALSSGIFALTGPAAGPWTYGAGPLTVQISAHPWTMQVQTGPGGQQLGGINLHGGVEVALPSLQPAVTVSLQTGPVTASLTRPSGGPVGVTLDAPPWTSNLGLIPPAPDLGSQALQLLPRLALSSAASAVMDALIGPQINTGPIDALLANFGQWLQKPSAFGASGGSGSAGFDGTRINNLLSTIGAAAGLPAAPSGGGLVLPGGIALTVSGGDPLRVSLAATGVGGGVLDIGADLSIDRLGHVTPDGTATLHLTLPGGSWANVAIALGASPAGLTLSVSPGSGGTITLLPSVSGLQSILSGLGTALLPALLDAALPHLQGSPVATPILEFTAALGLSDTTGNFAGHASTWAEVGQPGWLDGLRTSVPTAALTAVAGLINGPFATSGVSASHDSESVTVSIVPGGAGQVSVRAGWDTAGPLVSLGLTGFVPAGSPVSLDGTLGYANGQLACSLDLAVTALSDLPIDFTPALSLSASTGQGFAVSLLPFGPSGVADLSIEIAPSPGIHPSTPNLTRVATQWLLPVIADAALSALSTELGQPLWAGGLSAQTLLTSAGVLQTRSSPHAGQPPLELVPNLDLSTVPLKVLQAASALSINIPPNLTVSLTDDAGKLGVRLKGFIDVPTGSLDVRALFGGPNGQPGPDSGVTLYLLDVSDSAHPKLRPSLHVVGLGVGLLGQNGAPVIDLSQFTMGGVEGYLFFDMDFLNGSGQPAISVTNIGAGLELDKIGIPLAVAGQSSGGSNSVAQSIVGGGSGGSDGSSSGGGDSRPVNPAVSVSVYDRNGTVTIQISGATSIAIPVHQSFGPMHLEQVEVDIAGSTVGLGLDGGLTLAGLTVDVIDLGVSIPLHYLVDPSHWSLDLRGLAASLDEPGISIAGGLMKSATTPVEYDGMLTASIAELGGITVVGSYARPSDAQGGYTSLFVFVALDIPLGGPPFLFILGLGGGVGINRELIVPDITGVETFVLVEAIDDNSLANDPMTALMQMGQLMPPRRGAYWIAAGLHFSTFALVTTTAVVYVSLDRGVEIGVLGLSRMALPTPDVALVNIELALKARYSTAEQLLSIQAQLTDNSWLFYKDCQLTGGFAFFMWFAKAQFVLTLGGYHPAFQVPDGFPTVPRLGFHWQVSDVIVIKGESYFALTTSCVMAGGRLEAVFDAGFVRAWFDAHADFLIAWDPFAYNVDIGISVGVALQITICFIGCVTIGISVSVGADLSIAGPPFHGTVTVDLDVCSVTIPFGGTPAGPPPLSWEDFSSKYIISGDPAGTAVDAAPTDGLIPVDPPGAAPAPGDSDHPWRMLPEWTFQVSSRAAAKSVKDIQSGTFVDASDVGEIDLAPMGSQYTNVTSAIDIVLESQQPDGSWAATTPEHDTVVTTASESQMPEGTWHYTDQDSRKASARTITAVTGASVTGHAFLPNQGSDIHIATLVDDLPAYAKPLPLDPGIPIITVLRGYGVNAGELQALGSASSSQTLIDAAQSLLSGSLAAVARQAVGLPAGGLGPMSVRALQQFRSSPPVITPLAAGLDMRPVDVPTAPATVPTPPALAEALQAPRIKAVLESRPRPAAPTPAPTRTTVLNVAAATNAARTSPPAPPILAGARLIRVPLPGSARPTSLAAAGRWQRSAELGTPTSTTVANGTAADEAALIGNGLTVAAGAYYVIELPAGAGTLAVTGDAARITLLDRGGRVLSDQEGSGAWTVVVPVAAALAVVGALGVQSQAAGSSSTVTTAGAGAITSRQSPAGTAAATGWIGGNQLPLVAAQTLLCRGGWIVLDRPHRSLRSGVATHVSMERAATAVEGVAAAETWMPTSTGAVAVLLDQVDPTAALNGDLGIAAEGATLSARPLRIGGGRRLALVYDVTARPEAPGEVIGVTVASQAGWRIAGVVGLPGRAAEWAARWHGQVPESLVPDGPLGPDGQIEVRYTAGGTGQ
jgi:hypothetical protein